jgi:hypothetical protein
LDKQMPSGKSFPAAGRGTLLARGRDGQLV